MVVLFSPILIQLFHHYDPLLQYLPTCLLHTFDTLCRVLTPTKAADMESLGGEVSVFLVPTELPYYSSVFKSCSAHRQKIMAHPQEINQRKFCCKAL